MVEGEINKNPEETPQEKTLIKEVTDRVHEKEAQGEEIGDQETRENIAKNAQNFWSFFNKIPSEDYSQLDTPEKLIEALNKAGGCFVQEGGKFKLHEATYQVVEIHPPNVMDDQEEGERILNLCKKEGYSFLSGTNFWDNLPEGDSFFIPVVYICSLQKED